MKAKLMADRARWFLNGEIFCSLREVEMLVER